MARVACSYCLIFSVEANISYILIQSHKSVEVCGNINSVL